METETDIAKRLQENIPKPTPQPTQPNPHPVDEPGERGFVDDLGDNINIYKLYDYFNVDPNYRTGENEQKLQTIYRWAADKAQSTDYLAIANVLTAYSSGMGVTGLDTNNLQRMYEYIQLDKQINSLQQEQGKLYG